MEIILKGRIKNLVKDFGFIYCEINKTDYYFHETSIESKEKLDIGNLVSFTLRENKGREGSHAIRIQKLKDIDKIIPALQIKKKRKYYFESDTDLVIGLRHIKDKLEIQKSKANKNKSKKQYAGRGKNIMEENKQRSTGSKV